MDVKKYLDNPQFLHSTSNGLTLRMNFLKDFIRDQKLGENRWDAIRPKVEDIINERFPATSPRKKKEYLENSLSFYNRLPIPKPEYQEQHVFKWLSFKRKEKYAKEKKND